MSNRNYKYYQPNTKDVKDSYGDCVVRSLMKATGLSWFEVFDELVKYARNERCMPNSKPAYENFLKDNGFTYCGISNKSGCTRPTVASFATNHTSGTYILVVAHHLVCTVDGIYYDTWNCGAKSMYGYWEKQ